MAGIPVLLVTANVGSIFEEPGVMLKVWSEEFLSTVSRLDPKFIALHCQEVGGKNYEQSMRHVEDFVRLLMSSEELRLFDKVRVFLDEDFSSAEHFTALGNFYFVHESLKDVLLWDFKECTFIPVTGKEVHSGNIEGVTTKEKAKFPQDFFPECKWSRKGFLRTRWSVNGTVFDLINIHLFHDASNFIAMETFPSVYSKTRRRALEHTLERFHNDQYENAPYFLFGDFNFRTDTAGVIKKLTEDTHESKLSSKGSISRLQFRNNEDNLVLTLGKKEFSHCEHRHVFSDNSGRWLREYDRELEDFEGRLFEFPIEFVPSYPFEEDIKQGSYYMQTRVPAWCDRILLSPTAKTLVQNITNPDAVDYGIIGPSTCMGDHKPVYLRALLSMDAGMINCCTTNPPQMCFKVPDNYHDLLSMLPGCQTSCYTRIRTNERSSATLSTATTATSSRLLHAIPIEHDPYTPDSMDSPSPSAFSVPVDQVNSLKTNEVKVLDSAVSPTLLKSKLELVIKSNERERRHLSEYRLHSWPETEDKLNQGVREHRCNSDVSWQRRGDKTIITSSSDTSSDDNAPCHHHVIIPRIAIINASNFQSNESSVHLQQQDERLQTNFLQSDATSGQGSSLQLDEQEYIKEKLENNQDSGLDTLDVEERLSRGFSSNETTSTLPLDSEKEDFGKLRRFNENSEEKEKIRRFDGNDEGKMIFCGKREGERLNEEKEGDKRLGVIEDDDNDGRDVKQVENNQEMIFDDKSETTPPQICTPMLEDDGSDNMRVTAYRVTQRCRRDIVKRRSCCNKCCCIIS